MNEVQLKQSHMTEIRLNQLPGTKEDAQSGRKDHQAKDVMNQKPDDINSKLKRKKIRR